MRMGRRMRGRFFWRVGALLALLRKVDILWVVVIGTVISIALMD